MSQHLHSYGQVLEHSSSSLAPSLASSSARRHPPSASNSPKDNRSLADTVVPTVEFSLHASPRRSAHASWVSYSIHRASTLNIQIQDVWATCPRSKTQVAWTPSLSPTKASMSRNAKVDQTTSSQCAPIGMRPTIKFQLSHLKSVQSRAEPRSSAQYTSLVSGIGLADVFLEHASCGRSGKEAVSGSRYPIQQDLFCNACMRGYPCPQQDLLHVACSHYESTPATGLAQILGGNSHLIGRNFLGA